MALVKDKQKVFSTLDISQAYLFVPLAKESREFKLTHMAFGLLDTSTRYNRVAKDAKEEAREGYSNYMDQNFHIFSKSNFTIRINIHKA